MSRASGLDAIKRIDQLELSYKHSQLVALGQLPGTGIGCCEHADAWQRIDVDEGSECCLDTISAG